MKGQLGLCLLNPRAGVKRSYSGKQRCLAYQEGNEHSGERCGLVTLDNRVSEEGAKKMPRSDQINHKQFVIRNHRRSKVRKQHHRVQITRLVGFFRDVCWLERKDVYLKWWKKVQSLWHTAVRRGEKTKEGWRGKSTNKLLPRAMELFIVAISLLWDSGCTTRNLKVT